MPGGTMRLTLRSMSEGDLRSIAKRLIGGALNDRDQMAKLHRAIYDELYFQFQLKSEENKIDKKLENLWSPKNPITQSSSSVDKSERCVSENAPGSTKKDEDLCVSDRSVNPVVESVNVKNPTKKSVTMRLSERSWNETRQKNEEAFNLWKREKTKTLRRLCKEKRMKKQQQLATQQIEYEKRRAIHEAYKRSKMMQAPKRRVQKCQKKIVNDDCLMMLEQANERIIANEAAFSFSMKQRNDCESREKSQRKIPMFDHDSAFKFGAWLDRLDLVLHEKYMRERRHLVRSFYCQPAYYRAAGLSSRV